MCLCSTLTRGIMSTQNNIPETTEYDTNTKSIELDAFAEQNITTKTHSVGSVLALWINKEMHEEGRNHRKANWCTHNGSNSIGQTMPKPFTKNILFKLFCFVVISISKLISTTQNSRWPTMYYPSSHSIHFVSFATLYSMHIDYVVFEPLPCK